MLRSQLYRTDYEWVGEERSGIETRVSESLLGSKYCVTRHLWLVHLWRVRSFIHHWFLWNSFQLIEKRDFTVKEAKI